MLGKSVYVTSNKLYASITLNYFDCLDPPLIFQGKNLLKLRDNGMFLA